MSDRKRFDRYRHIGRLYDVLSLERLVYAMPRRRLLTMVGPLTGATVVDVGCGTGLNFPGLRALVGPAGRVIGIDASPSMLGAAQRRIHRAGWANITTVHSDITSMLLALERAGVDSDDIDVIIATFVISTTTDDSAFWHIIDHLSTVTPRLVAIADLGKPSSSRHLRDRVLRALAALGGNHPSSRPWIDLAQRADDARLEQLLGGHVHLAVGHCRRVPLAS